MKAVLDELIEFTTSYLENDQVEKKREMYREKEGQLDPQEKLAFLEYLSKDRGLFFMLFCEEAKIKLNLDQAKSFSRLMCESTQNGISYKAIQRRNSDFFLKMPDLIPAEDVCQYCLYVTKLAIEFDNICTLQELLQKDKTLHFIQGGIEEFEPLLQKQADLRVGENVRSYILNGTIGENWENFIVGVKYVPDIYVDYFATEGKEICKENLKSYKKSRLLSDKTTLRELNDFVDQYNWDDGVEIPYFIMYHKNCDLELRKKLFELGAGDCIDEDTYKDTNKDPWKRFILELKELIDKEEQ